MRILLGDRKPHIPKLLRANQEDLKSITIFNVGSNHSILKLNNRRNTSYKIKIGTSFLQSITFDDKLFHSPGSFSIAIVLSSDLFVTLPCKLNF